MSATGIKRLARRLPVIAFVVVLLVGLLVWWRQGSFNEHLRRAVVWEFSRALGRKVRVKESRLRYLPAQRQAPATLILSMREITILPREKTTRLVGEQAFARIPEINLTLELGGLLRREGFVPSVRRLIVLRPQINAVRDPLGRWNFADLLQRKPAAAPLNLQVQIRDGRLTVWDFTPPKGLAVPQYNRLVKLDTTAFISRARQDVFSLTPQPMSLLFRLSGDNPEGRLGRLFASGQSVSYASAPGASTRNMVNGAFVVSDADIGYLWGYRALAPQVQLAGGRAEVAGYFRLSKGGEQPAGLDYSVTIRGRRTQVTLPWVKGPIQQASSLVRISNGLVQFADMKGQLGGAQVSGAGYIEATPTAGLPALVIQPGKTPLRVRGGKTAPAGRNYAFHFNASGVREAELARLLPATVAGEVSRVTASTRVGVSIVGRGGQSAIFGLLASPDLTIKHGPAPAAPRLAEVRNLKADFVYSQRSLGATASGELLGGSLTGAFFLPPGGAGSFAASLAGADFPAQALAGNTSVTGRAWVNLVGRLPPLSAKGLAPALSGEAVLVDGALRTRMSNERMAQLPFRAVSAEFSYLNGTLFLPQVTAATGYGYLDFAGRLSPGGGIVGYLEGQGIDLRGIGKVLGSDTAGTAFVSARISGATRHPQAELRGDIFSGRVEGIPYDWLGADLLLQDRVIPRFEVTFQRGSGEGRFRGRVRLPTAGDAGDISAQGKIEKARLDEWLPARWQGRAAGVLDAEVQILGAPASPQIAADFQITRPWLAGMQFDAAGGTVRYSEGRLTLPAFLARADGTQFLASGEMRPDGALDLSFSADRLSLAALLQSYPSVSAAGWLSLQGRVQGTRTAPRLDMQLRAEELAFADRRAGDITADLAWRDRSFEIRSLDFLAGGGRLSLSGDVSQPPGPAAENAADWQVALRAKSAGMEVGLLLDLLERALQVSGGEGVEQVLDALEGLPRPVHGFLAADATIFGPLGSPKGEASFAISDATIAGQALSAIEGSLGFTAQELTIHSFAAREGDAVATATGSVRFAGETNLDVEVHNLQAEVLQPWIKGTSSLGGSADIFLRVTGPTRQPLLRGDLEVADPVVGGVRLERLKIDRFTLAGERFEIEDLRLVKGPHLARISASLPYRWAQSALLENEPLHLTAALEDQDLSFISALWPAAGELSGPLNAQLEIAGTPARPRLESGFLRAAGQWRQGARQAALALESRVENQQLLIVTPDGKPGLSVRLQQVTDAKLSELGRASAQGFYDPFAGPRERWGLGRYDIALALSDLQIRVHEVGSGTANGNLNLVGDPQAAQEDRIAGDLRISRAHVTLPRGKFSKSFSWRPRFSPYLQVNLKVEKLEVSATNARVEFSGQGKVGGRLGYEPLGLEATLKAERGRLAFPTAVAEIRSMEVTINKQPDEPLYALGRVEAEARVGRYRVTLSGGGQLFPTSDMRIVAATTPPLSPAQATALLLGVPPSLLGPTGLPAEEALGQQVAESFSTSVTTLAAAGLSAPLLRAIGLNELSFAVTPLTTRVELGKRLAERVYIYYLSSLTGTRRASLTRLIIDITPSIAVGLSINELEQIRYEVQSTRTF